MLTRVAARHQVLQAFCAACAICVILPFAAAQPRQTTDLAAVTPVDDAFCSDMKLHHVLGPRSPVGCDRLSLVRFSYVGFDKTLHDDGEVVVLDAVAPYVATIFSLLRDSSFPIAKAQLMNQYDGNDDASMDDNNTSAFNDRSIAGSKLISLHAYGLAIDVNPIQNPIVTNSGVHPRAGMDYANRSERRSGKNARPGMVEPVIDVFAENGFLIWGGNWNNPIDYQHFQVGRAMARRLVAAAPQTAASIFNRLVQQYRDCLQTSAGDLTLRRRRCIRVADPTAGP
jgi:D-alanyl-D-alanine carboxypeptidase